MQVVKWTALSFANFYSQDWRSYVTFGKSCIRVVEEADRVVLQFADGTSYEADLVIAADGSSSAIRSAAGQAEPESLNTLAIYGKTPFKPELIPNGLERSGVLAIGPPGQRSSSPRSNSRTCHKMRSPVLAWMVLQLPDSHTLCGLSRPHSQIFE